MSDIVTGRIGARIRECRLAAGMTQEELAGRAGVSLSTLRRFERTGDISLKVFVEMAFVLRRMDGFEALFSKPPVRSLFEPRPVERKRARKTHAS